METINTSFHGYIFASTQQKQKQVYFPLCNTGTSWIQMMLKAPSGWEVIQLPPHNALQQACKPIPFFSSGTQKPQYLGLSTIKNICWVPSFPLLGPCPKTTRYNNSKKMRGKPWTEDLEGPIAPSMERETEWDIKCKTFAQRKDKRQTGRKYLQIMYLITD